MEMLNRILKKVLVVLAIAMSLYHLYTAAFGLPEALLHRAIHLIFTLVLIFLLSMTRRSADEKGKMIWDAILLLLVIVSIGHLFINYEYVITRYAYIHPLTFWDFWLGIIFTLILLEASRRSIGWALPITAVVFLLYGVFGHLLPDIIRHTGFTVETVVDQLYLTTEGIFGIPAGVSATLCHPVRHLRCVSRTVGYRPVFHGLCNLPGRRRQGRTRKDFLRVLFAVRHHLGKCGGQRHGGRVADDSLDETNGVQT